MVAMLFLNSQCSEKIYFQDILIFIVFDHNGKTFFIVFFSLIFLNIHQLLSESSN